MNRTLLFLALVLLAGSFFAAVDSNLLAQTVVVNNNLTLGPGTGGYSFGISQNVTETDGTSANFSYDGSSIAAYLIVADEGSDWYVVHSGDYFSRASIEANQFSPLLTFPANFHGPVTVGTEFYLGVSTGQGLNVPEDRTVYGWAHLKSVSGVLTMIGNVMSYDSPGIIVGTTRLVPEPATATMFACGVVLFIRSRRRR